MMQFFYFRWGKARLLLLLLVLLSFSLLKAQETDSTSMEESVENEDVEVENEAFKPTIPDTPVLRLLPDSVSGRYRNEKKFAYANDPSFWIKSENKKKDAERIGFWDELDAFLRNKNVRAIVYVFLALVVVFVLYRIFAVNNLFVANPKNKKDSIQEEVGELIDDEAIDDKIKSAISKEDHRDAVRFLYIKTLQLLHRKSLIRYHAQATNDIYVQQMNSSAKGKDFKLLTRIFEYAWYGEFKLNTAQFESIYERFKKFYEDIH